VRLHSRINRILLIDGMGICHTLKYYEVCDWVLTYVTTRAQAVTVMYVHVSYSLVVQVTHLKNFKVAMIQK
jgi:hypothetical protein